MGRFRRRALAALAIIPMAAAVIAAYPTDAAQAFLLHRRFGDGAIVFDHHARRAAMVAFDGGTLRIVDTLTGVVVRTLPASSLAEQWENEPRYFLDADTRADRFYVVVAIGSELSQSMDGWLTTLDARSGAVLRRLEVGQDTESLAVDEGRGRAFVGDGSGAVAVADAATGARLRTLRAGIFPEDIRPLAGGHALEASYRCWGHPRYTDGWGWVPGWLRGHLPLPAPAEVIRALNLGYFPACPPGLESRVARTIAVP